MTYMNVLSLQRIHSYFRGKIQFRKREAIVEVASFLYLKNNKKYNKRKLKGVQKEEFKKLSKKSYRNICYKNINYILRNDKY